MYLNLAYPVNTHVFTLGCIYIHISGDKAKRMTQSGRERRIKRAGVFARPLRRTLTKASLFGRLLATFATVAVIGVRHPQLSLPRGPVVSPIFSDLLTPGYVYLPAYT